MIFFFGFQIEFCYPHQRRLQNENSEQQQQQQQQQQQRERQPRLGFTWDDFGGGVELVLEAVADVAEERHLAPAGAQRARTGQAVALAFGAHVVLHLQPAHLVVVQHHLRAVSSPPIHTHTQRERERENNAARRPEMRIRRPPTENNKSMSNDVE